jgi:hypothetical protein
VLTKFVLSISWQNWPVAAIAAAVSLVVIAFVVRADGTAVSPVLGPHPEIERAVYEAQVFENLELYCNPKSLRQEKLEQYFVPERDGGEAVKDVVAAVRRQIDRSLRYGQDSRLDTFVVLRSSLSSDGERGQVRVRERWHLPTYRSDGTRVFEKRADFDHEIDYTLRKIGGRWRIQSTTTPYAH